MRISGVDLPQKKKLFVSLTYVYGIGFHSAYEICKKAGIDPHLRTRDICEDDAMKISSIIKSDYVVEGDLRTKVISNVRRLMSINSYRGIRLKRGLPVRGQRTHTNARTSRSLRGRVAS